MDSVTLQACAEHLVGKSAHVVTLAKDYVHRILIDSQPTFGIANTGESLTSGEHWTVFYTYVSSNGVLQTEYFDSYGNLPSYYGIEYNYPVTKYNATVLQNDDTDFCGQLCLYFIYLRLHRYPMSHALQGFTIDKSKNENLALAFYNKIESAARKNMKYSICQSFGCVSKEFVLAAYGYLAA